MLRQNVLKSLPKSLDKSLTKSKARWRQQRVASDAKHRVRAAPLCELRCRIVTLGSTDLDFESITQGLSRANQGFALNNCLRHDLQTLEAVSWMTGGTNTVSRKRHMVCEVFPRICYWSLSVFFFQKILDPNLEKNPCIFSGAPA